MQQETAPGPGRNGRPPGVRRTVLVILGLSVLPGANLAAQPSALPGLQSTASISRDETGIPHICARTEADAVFLQGYVHGRDRLFQMDTLRRTFGGTLSELFGGAALFQDVQFRALDLRTGAVQTLELLADQGHQETLGLLEGYAEGVNAALELEPLPPEYDVLEISTVAPWTTVDTLLVLRGFLFGQSFDLDDLERTVALESYVTAGESQGFDGEALFLEDVFRSAPFEPTTPLSSLRSSGQDKRMAPTKPKLPLDRRTLELADGLRQRFRGIAALAHSVSSETVNERGSNWWLVGSNQSATGVPLLAADPHFALDVPALFFENHLMVSADGTCGLSAPPDVPLDLNVSGVSLPGVPWIVQGCNDAVCWASATHPADVTDVFEETLVVDNATGLPTATLFEGQAEPLVPVTQSFRQNVLGDNITDNLETVVLPPEQGGTTFFVPRRGHGPLVDFDTSSEPPLGLSVQYTGWGPSFDIEGWRRLAHSQNLEAFRDTLDFFDIGSQSWAYADKEGNIATFTSGEIPLREDLEAAGAADGGVPPFFIRDGSHALDHEWLAVTTPALAQSSPYAILPSSELPQSINPSTSLLLSANNDLTGATLDNNPLNQLRPTGGLYYLSPLYADGLRAGRIERLLNELTTSGPGNDGAVSLDELKTLQANNQLLDAELLLPYLLDAFNNASAATAPTLKNLATDPAIEEAITRLRAWDFSTPTGLPSGFDPGNDPDSLPPLSTAEIANSVAATLWSVFRGQLVQTVIDDTLSALDLLPPGSSQAYTALAHHLQTFDQNSGVGASGVAFFPLQPGLDAEQSRDQTLLMALRDALDLLKGDTFAAAYGGSTNLDDYRWGALHRITFDHRLGGPFNVPPAGGFDDLSPELQGLSRAGGYQTVDAAPHSARADGVNDFRFGSGPARRFVAELATTGPQAEQILPGGQSGIPGAPQSTDQLGRWLTNRYNKVLLTPQDVAGAAVDVEVLEPAREPCIASATTLCLHGDRFLAELTWSASENLEAGQVSSTSDHSGVFSFFDPANWEVMVKVLDGCPVNGHFWVFVAPATDLEFTLTVRDLAQPSATFSLFNPLGRLATSVADVEAFATCP